MPKILDEWDKLRLERGKDGDEENTERASKKSRHTKSLFMIAKDEYQPEEKGEKREQVDQWLSELAPDAEFNISAYVDCFLSENLVRKFMHDQKTLLNDPSKNEVSNWQKREQKRKDAANISFSIRKDDDGLSYLGMDFLAKSIEGTKKSAQQASLIGDAVSYKPIRNAVSHTGLLTKDAKEHLNLTFKNIQARVRNLLSSKV